MKKQIGVLFVLLHLCNASSRSVVAAANVRTNQKCSTKTREPPFGKWIEEARLLGCCSPLISASMFGAASAVLLAGTAMEPVSRALYFWRTAGPAIFHYKFTQWWLEASKADIEKRDLVYESLHDRYAEPALKMMIRQKGLYVKLGQVLSSRPDFLPSQYIERFATVQDSIPQWPIDQVRAIVEKSLIVELGLSWRDVFESMDDIALGSASIGQVHRAVLTEKWAKTTGYRGDKEAAVKVMHPNSQKLFAYDFDVFRWVCRIALPGWKGFLDELERRIMSEFDYRHEATSLDEVRKNMATSPYKSRVYIPQPLQELCCRHVLVMELLKGRKLVDSFEDGLANAMGGHDLAKAYLAKKQREILLGSCDGTDYDAIWRLPIVNKLKLLWLRRVASKYIDLLIDVHGYQIFQNGCFNGDPHPGNCLQLKDGRLGLIDFGQTRRLTETERYDLARIVCALNDPSTDAIGIDYAMQTAGFQLRDASAEMMVKYATIFFDSDEDSKHLGFATPQLYFASLMASNPLVVIPDSAVFVARTSFLFRGIGSGVGSGPLRTSQRWQEHAAAAISQVS
jgi:aarF domain-containing kinase